MDMELSGRRKSILAAVVEQYIRTGEPVGSRSLLDSLPMALSSATVRNEMAELSALGLLEQPHTSAGRVPSHAGYRYYVDHLMGRQELDEALRRKIERAVSATSDDPERVLARAGEVLADLTNCAAVSATAFGETASVKRVEMVAVGAKTAMLVLLTSTGVLKSKLCRCDSELTPALFESFYSVTSSMLVGRPLGELSVSAMQTLAASVGENVFTMLPLMAGVAELAREALLSDVRLEGQQNLLSYRELEENAFELMEFLRQGEPLFSMLGAQGKGGVKLFIGKENQYKQLHHSSVILANYSVNDQDGGSIGVIGPTRLDYAKLIPSVRYLTDLVGRILSSALE